MSHKEVLYLVKNRYYLDNEYNKRIACALNTHDNKRREEILNYMKVVESRFQGLKNICSHTFGLKEEGQEQISCLCCGNVLESPYNSYIIEVDKLTCELLDFITQELIRLLDFEELSFEEIKDYIQRIIKNNEIKK